MAAQASALIPVKVGLTLSSIWLSRSGDYEHECLKQVVSADERGLVMTESCPVDEDRRPATFKRRVCRSDLRDAYMYHSGQTAEGLPDVIGGTTTFSFSTTSLVALKRTGEMRHRYVDIDFNARRNALFVRADQDGTLKRRDRTQPASSGLDLPDTVNLIVNNRIAQIPVVHAWGLITGEHGGIDEARATIVDDERFPLVLSYRQMGAHFSIKITRISYPTTGGIETALANDQRVDVYGIYFDFASDRLRPESEPVLREIAAALAANTDWALAINGHTDDVGGDAFNLALSRRRSEAVRHALVERYHIDESRLTAAGFGASQPKASNGTIEGRARNRRVELVRR